MWIMARYYDGPPAKSAQGAVDYVGGHLQDSKEVGPFSRVKGYLSREGLIEPVIDPDPWSKVGWDGIGLPPPRLLRNLCQGCDIDGSKITRQQVLFRTPREIVISLPCELSEATKDDPESAHALLQVAALANLESLEEGCTRGRSGKGRKAQPDWVEAKPLVLNYLHAENRAKEPDLHLHGYIFPVALAEDGFRAFDNGLHVARLSKEGGARDRITQAVVQAAAERGYIVEIEPGRADGEGAQGARVVCPDGRVIERGSVFRERRAEILAAQEIKRELGQAPLTHRELELVRRESGKIPSSIKGVKRRDRLEKKLRAFGLLDGEGRIQEANELEKALQEVEAGMAVAQVSLQELGAMSHAQEAADLTMDRRIGLTAHVPAIIPDTDQARIRWTTSYDQVLELVAANPEGLGTAGLDKKTRDNLSKLKRAGILAGEKQDGLMRYTLAPAGLARLKTGRRDQAQTFKIVEGMVAAAVERTVSPDRVRGRLESAGIKVVPEAGRFEIGAAGRTVTDPELMAKTAIQTETPSAPDRAWWRRLWDMRRELPEILRRAILSPAEWARRWSHAAGKEDADLARHQDQVRRGKLAARTAAEAAEAERKKKEMEAATIPGAHRTHPNSPTASTPSKEIGHGIRK